MPDIDRSVQLKELTLKKKNKKKNNNLLIVDKSLFENIKSTKQLFSLFYLLFWFECVMFCVILTSNFI